MKAIKILSLAGAVALVAALGVSTAQAGFAGQQYYTGWSYSNQGYYYCTYNYKPYVEYPSYCYNYCVWYPSTPSYCYYFNPYKATYWGRFDLKTKGYSLLAEKDRAGQLKDIPEKAFPAEGSMPNVPDAKDKVALAEPPDLPVGEKPVVKKTTKGDAAADAATADAAADALTTTPADAGADKPAGDTPAADQKANPATPPADGAAPASGAAPATGAAATTPAVGGAAPADGAAPGGPAAPAGGPATPADSGTGVVPPTEPVAPPPAAGGAAATPPAGGTAAPVDGAPATGGPVVAPNGGYYYPGSCHKQFGTCPTHGYGPGYNGGWYR